MIPVPSGVRVWLAVGRTDMRRGMNGLALQVQEALRRDPHAGDLYVLREGENGLPDDAAADVQPIGAEHSLKFGNETTGLSRRNALQVMKDIIRIEG